MTASFNHIDHWNSSIVSFECGTPILYDICLCKKYRIYHSYYFEEQVPTEVVEILGIYEKIHSSENSQFGAITFKQQSKDFYLFSVHQNGRVWSIRHGTTMASHIDFGSYDENDLV